MKEWLIVLCATGACIVLIMLFIRHLEGRVNEVDTKQQEDEERISSLEVHDTKQDQRLDAHRRAIIQVKKDVKGLGKDIGWDDSNRATQVMDMAAITHLTNASRKKPDDEPPDAA